LSNAMQRGSQIILPNQRYGYRGSSPCPPLHPRHSPLKPTFTVDARTRQNLAHLSSTVLCSCQDISPRQRHGYRLLLDRTRLLKSRGVDPHEQFSSETKLVKCGAAGVGDVLCLGTMVLRRGDEAGTPVVRWGPAGCSARDRGDLAKERKSTHADVEAMLGE
jgi:hypothetical protein